MLTESLDYYLPEDLIAQEPVEPRDSSKLLVCRLDNSPFEIVRFSDLPDLLKSGDNLVVNSARVMHARLIGFKNQGGAKIEILLLEKMPGDGSGSRYKALLNRRRRLDTGSTVIFPGSAMFATIAEMGEGMGNDVVEFHGVDCVEDEIEKIGYVPLPPYIKDYDGDSERYQTVYSNQNGSVAAPTAGLHFTDELLGMLDSKGVGRIDAHLRVGWGTFSPVRTERIEDHRLHGELGELDDSACGDLNACRAEGGRIIAVGTTMTRLLESAVDDNGMFKPFCNSTSLFIYPGYKFRAIDGLITNFHLPKTSLLALVAALAGTERILDAYNFAVSQRLRFYSFGDAMIII